MADTETESLIEEITAAFRHVERGNGTTLHEARAMDDYRSVEEQREARALDTDLHWWEIPKRKLEELNDAFGFLDAEGLRYYLAPFLIYSLEYPESDWPVGDSAAFSLARRDRIPDFAILCEAQSKMIARYLHFVSVVNRMEGGIIAESADEALQNYWSRFLPEPGG